MIVIFDTNLSCARELKTMLKESCDLDDSKICVYDGSAKRLSETIKNSTKKIIAIFIALDEDYLSEQLQLAECISGLEKNINIVFTTDSTELAQSVFLDSYKINTCAVIFKPYTTESLIKTVNKINHLERNGNVVWVKLKQAIISINTDEVEYVGIDGHCTTFHTTSKIYKTYTSIEEVAGSLPETFMRCHKSFIVNTDFISEYKNRSSLTLKNDSVIPISRAYQKIVRERIETICK